MNIHPSSAWSEQQITDYLTKTDTPIRLSCQTNDGYPVICSVWFDYRDGFIWAASHKNSHLIKSLKKHPKVGFEIANNEFPYHGIRGKGDISLIDDSEGQVLETLINKYLQGSNTQLAHWLLSRKADEYAIKIQPLSINSWDFSKRMQAPAKKT